jgi:hypothetical protein
MLRTEISPKIKPKGNERNKTLQLDTNSSAILNRPLMCCKIIHINYLARQTFILVRGHQRIHFVCNQQAFPFQIAKEKRQITSCHANNLFLNVAHIF